MFHLSNWRPISLLNAVYKIRPGCIAQSIKHIYPIPLGIQYDVDLLKIIRMNFARKLYNSG